MKLQTLTAEGDDALARRARKEEFIGQLYCKAEVMGPDRSLLEEGFQHARERCIDSKPIYADARTCQVTQGKPLLRLRNVSVPL